MSRFSLLKKNIRNGTFSSFSCRCDADLFFRKKKSVQLKDDVKIVATETHTRCVLCTLQILGLFVGKFG